MHLELGQATEHWPNHPRALWLEAQLRALGAKGCLLVTTVSLAVVDLVQFSVFCPLGAPVHFPAASELCPYSLVELCKAGSLLGAWVLLASCVCSHGPTPSQVQSVVRHGSNSPICECAQELNRLFSPCTLLAFTLKLHLQLLPRTKGLSFPFLDENNKLPYLAGKLGK